MQFQMLVQELTFSTRMILSLLEGISLLDARIKPDEQSWSILEVLCHLLDEEREDFRDRIDFILHRQQTGDLHQIDPQGWVNERKYNQRDLEDMKSQFAAERDRSLRWLNTLPQTNWNTRYVSQFGEITAGEMLASWIAHDNLHLRQLVELRRKHVERLSGSFDIGYAGDW